MKCTAILIIFAALLAPSSFAQNGGRQKATAQESLSLIPLQTIAELYANADPALTVEKLAGHEGDPLFSPVGGKMIAVGAKNPVIWLRFTIPEALRSAGAGTGEKSGAAWSGLPPQWLLVVRPSFSIILDQVELYVPSVEGGFESFATGALRKAFPGEAFSRYFVFQLSPTAFGGEYCYLRLSSTTEVKVDVFLETSLARDSQEKIDFFLYGVLFGFLAAMFLYSLALFFSLKDKSYLFYSLYTLSAGLWLFFLHGFSKALFGQSPGTDQAMLWVWVGLMLAWGSVFVAHFLRLKDGLAALNRLVLALGALGIVVSVAGLLGWYDIAFSLSHYLGIILPILGIATALIRLIQGFPSSLYFFVAWIFLGIGGLAFALMGLKALPVNFWTINSSAIGVALQSVFLLVALSDRFRRLEGETERLEKIQANYEALNLTDENTGLPNKRFLMAELGTLVEKAKQRKTMLSLLLIDVDNFGCLSDFLGSAKPEDVLAGLASIAKASTREGDRVCSLGGDRLAVILPGIGAQAALKAAERIRVRFAQEGYRGDDSGRHTGESLMVSLSIGVVELGKDDDLDSLLDRSDRAVHEAKVQGKNRSVYLRSVE
ncbi:hypothetical protein SDC9_05396 [bioreactor metagenome]|uniref:GGDEF domain-containing protein n=1 Tax=bioreactor metagenome TaxID=1076179 RepID=A0A644SYS4_9ZZZZ